MTITEDVTVLAGKRNQGKAFFEETKLHALKAKLVVKYLYILISANIRTLERKSDKKLVIWASISSEHRNV